jgi:RNA polymerase sigma-70 factor (ECF subfamily)
MVQERGAPVAERRTKLIAFEDAALVEQIKAGQTEVYGVLVQKYSDRLFNTCWRICGNLEDARDLTQEAFLKALEHIGGFAQSSSFYTWLYRVAVNLALSHRRQQSRRATTSLDATTGEEAGGSRLAQRLSDPGASSPPTAASQGELQGVVARALNELDDDHRAVIVLRDLEGFDYQEIGTILELPVGTVKSRLFRARNALREAVAPHLGRGSTGTD